MIDNPPFEVPRSPLELLDNIPEATLRRLKGRSGRLATQAVHAMEERLPFFAHLEASQRASVQLVVQTAVVNFVEWMRHPDSDVSYTAQAFEVVPQDLRRRLLSLSNLEILTMPISYLVYYIIVASLFQQMLITLFHGREGYIATFQIRCYAMIAQCFWLIPIVGIFLAEIGSLVVCARGFQRVQKLSPARSLFVAAVPVMISFLLSPAVI